MPVSDFECQIVRGKIDTYVDGGALSPAAMRGLEEHLAECADCKGLVADRRAALLGQLGSMPTHAVVSMPVENPLVAALKARAEAPATVEAKTEATERPKSAPRYAKAKAPASPAPTSKAKGAREALVEKASKPTEGKSPLSKPLMLAGLLAIVLVGMSYVTKGNGGQGALGPKAANAFAGTSVPSKTEAPKEPETTPVANPMLDAKTPIPSKTETKPAQSKPSEPKPVAGKPVEAAATEKPPIETTAKPEAPKPVPAKAETPKVAPAKPVVKAPAQPVVAKRPTVKRPVRRVVRRAVRKPVVRRKPVRRVVRARRPSSTVRVYGLDGRPLKP